MAPPVSVRPDDVCRRFERAPWSLIEEPEVCELCSHYEEADSTCTHNGADALSNS